MHNSLPKRRTPAHYCVYNEGRKSVIVYVTICTDKRKPVLCSQNAHRFLLEAWHAAHAWAVGRYVIMPDHIHLFCTPAISEAPSLTSWVCFWKAMASRWWQKIEDKPLWQKSFWDTQLKGRESYEEKWNYVLCNPVRAGLCKKPDDWPWQGELNVLEWY